MPDSAEIRLLTPGDARAYQALRLTALRQEPCAFASCEQEESSTQLDDVAAQLAASDRGAVLGAFIQSGLIAIAGIQRERHLKLAHKAVLWGVYVSPPHRNRGLARRLLARVLDHAYTALRVRQINLGVNAANPPAIALYRSLGFKTFGLEKAFMLIDGIAHDELLMVHMQDHH